MSAPEREGVLVSVPWPVCLFGDFSDVAGLPSVVAALDARTAAVAARTEGTEWTVRVPWATAPCAFSWPDVPSGVLPFFCAAAEVLGARRMSFSEAWTLQIVTRLPDAALLSASPALAALWTVALLALGGNLESFSGRETADLACEVYERGGGAAGGEPEVRAAVLGGALIFRPHAAESTLPVERRVPDLVLAFPPDAGPCGRLGEESRRAIVCAADRLRQDMAGFAWADADTDRLMPSLRALSDRDAAVAYACLRFRDIQAQAIALLENEVGFDDDAFGELLDETHAVLREYLGYVLPGLDPLLASAPASGALGCRVLTRDGSLVAFAPSRAEELANAFRAAGAPALVAPVSDGMRIERKRISMPDASSTQELL